MAIPTYTVNYVSSPAATAGFSLWGPAYDGPLVSAEMGYAKMLGYNCLRIFLSPQTLSLPPSSPFVFPRVTDFCQRALAAGLTLQPSLFDYWGNYGAITWSKNWVEAVAASIPAGVVSSVELQNETPYSSLGVYGGNYDTGWPTGHSETGQNVGQVLAVWAPAMIAFLRSTFPGVPVVTSAHTLADLTAGVTALAGALPDRWEYHYYDDPTLFTSEMAGIVAAAKPVPVRLGEAGCMASDSYEATWVQSIRSQSTQQGFGEPSLWMLFDVASGSSQFGGAQSFGLFRTNYSLKPAGRVMLDYELGSVVP
jgi:hypothetical protein